MQRIVFGALGAALLLLFSLPACKHDPAQTVEPDPVDTTGNGGNNGGGGNNGVACDPDSVYFQNAVLPLLLSNCTESGCHNEQDRQDGVILTSYENIMNTVDDVRETDWDDNELLEVLTENDPDKRMPRPPNAPLTQAQINLIAGWIAQGARNNGCNENAAGCNTDNVSFSAFVLPLVQTRCQGCHSGSAPQGNVNLSTYNDVKTVAANGKLYTALTRTTNWMPRGGAKLDDCTLDKIKAWVDAGAPNN